MPDAYRKARRLADEQRDSAVVVIVDDDRRPRSEAYDAVTLDEYQRDSRCGLFFDYVEEVQP